jgi:hypothetical protein
VCLETVKLMAFMVAGNQVQQLLHYLEDIAAIVAHMCWICWPCRASAGSTGFERKLFI